MASSRLVVNTSTWWKGDVLHIKKHDKKTTSADLMLPGFCSKNCIFYQLIFQCQICFFSNPRDAGEREISIFAHMYVSYP